MKKIITSIVLGILIIFSVTTLALRFFGYQNFIVKTDSMHPAITKYSFVYVRTMSTEEVIDVINIGDVVAVDLGGELPLMHRVISYNDQEITTHGDANDEGVNETANYDDVIGIVVFHIPLIGFIFFLFQNLYTWGIVALLIIAYFITKRIIKELRK